MSRGLCERSTNQPCLRRRTDPRRFRGGNILRQRVGGDFVDKDWENLGQRVGGKEFIENF